MGRRVVIDEECCCGSCVELCPDVFERTRKRKKHGSFFLKEKRRNVLKKPISTCPVECISWEV